MSSRSRNSTGAPRASPTAPASKHPLKRERTRESDGIRGRDIFRVAVGAALSPNRIQRFGKSQPALSGFFCILLGELFPREGEFIKGHSSEFGAEHESDLVFQAGSIDWVCGAWPPGRWGSARASSVGAYNGGAGATRSWTRGERSEFGATAPAADNHSWRLEVQPGRQRRPAQEEAGLPRFERRVRGGAWAHGGGGCRRGGPGAWWGA